ncbi:unnamed protein product [Closterium sp. Yama58-4]|nr:unnamed protein product [Closterium sp. Yama58-4]
MDLLFQKSLTDVIKSLRAAPSPAEEAKILAKTLRDVRREVKSSDPRSKAAALEKLLYLYMLGQAGGSDIAWAAFPSVEAMGCHRSFAVKYVGYLAAAHSLSAAPDVAVLATHQLRKDLTGQHPHDASLALSCIASAAPPGLAAELTTEVVALLNGTRVAGRRKATLAMLRIVHQQQQQQQSSASGGVGGSGGAGDDDELPALLARLAERLHDSDRAVVTAVVSLVCELVLHEQHQRLAGSTPIDPTLQSTPSQAQQTQQQQQRAGSGKPLASKYLPLAPDLFPLLHPSSSPWLLIKLVKTFAALAAAEPRVARKVAEPLAALLRATPSKSLLLECVRAVALSMRHVDSLRQLAIRVAATRLVANEPLSADPGAGGSAGDGCGGAGGGAAGSSTSAAPAAVVGAHDANVRLLGLRALEMFLPHHALEVLRYKAAIIASLDDADPAVQSAALRLITVLVTRPSLVPSVAALRQRMAGAAAARSPLCGELVTAVLQMCGAGGFERVTDFVWYVDVLQDICYVAIVGGGTSSASLALPSHAGAGAAAAASAAAADESVWSLAPLGNPSDSSHGYGRRVSGGLGLTHALSAGAAVADAWAGSERGREVGRHLVAVALGLPVPVADRPRVRAAALHLALRLVGDTALLRSRAGGDHVLAAAAFLLESAGALDSSLSSLLASLLQPSVLLLPPATQAVFLQAALKVLLALTARATPARLLPGGSPAAAAGSSLGAGGESPDVAVSGGCEAAGREALTGATSKAQLLQRGGWRGAQRQAAGRSGLWDGGEGAREWGAREHAAEQQMLRLADKAFKRNEQQRKAWAYERKQAIAAGREDEEQGGTEATLSHLIPTFPCPREQRLGVWADGGKWVCAVRSAFQRHPVVYSSQQGDGPGHPITFPRSPCVPPHSHRTSIGSNEEFSFEQDIGSLLHTTPLTFDPFVPPAFADFMNQSLHCLSFFSTGLSSHASLEKTRAENPEQEFLTLPGLMARHGHAYLPHVGWLKEEGEEEGVGGGERRREGRGEVVVGGGGRRGLEGTGVVARGGGEGMVRGGEGGKVPSVGQILVEMHRVNDSAATLAVVRHLEQLGYRLFHVEPNPVAPAHCVELALIHQHLVAV